MAYLRTRVRTRFAVQVNVFHCLLENEIKKFWELPSTRILSPDEQKCEKHFRSTYSRASNGRCIVRLLFKSGPPIKISESRSIARHRLTALTRRLNLNPELKEEYSNFLREYETLSHMKPVAPPSSSEMQVVYIPHHSHLRIKFDHKIARCF